MKKVSGMWPLLRAIFSFKAIACGIGIVVDYKSLVTYSEKKDDANPITKWTRMLAPGFLEISLGISLASHFVSCADVASYYRAFRLLVACRRHFIRTGKMPENLKDVSAGLPQETIVDPSLGTPYEIKTWVDGDMAHGDSRSNFRKTSKLGEL